MPLRLTVLNTDAMPTLAGLSLVLIGDDRVLARGTVSEDGSITFDAVVDGVQRLAVRVDTEQAVSLNGLQ
jgi:hypothetical protein